MTRSPSPWFDYPIEVFPHDTDYAGIVWHGSYVRWMEEARVARLRQVGVVYGDLVALGCDLPVVELAIRYRRALRMGDRAILRARLGPGQGLRLPWDYELWSADRQTLHLTATVQLVAVNMATGKVLRRLPPLLGQALAQMADAEPGEKLEP
ncbi:MAG: acyl-CoA thioesterase [Synechococcales cyanobacterium RM1_1_8]|nr:acyl-CoA thioesterase [Synechococcales cyanobacterium RM1_1_8]